MILERFFPMSYKFSSQTAQQTRETVQRDLGYLKDADIKKYEIDVITDGRTCSQCLKFKGKKYFVKNAKEGINLPPFCDECRCRIYGIIPEIDDAKLEREIKKISKNK